MPCLGGNFAHMLEAGLPQRPVGSTTAEKIPLAGGFGDPRKGRASRRRLMMLMTKSGYTLRIAVAPDLQR